MSVQSRDLGHVIGFILPHRVVLIVAGLDDAGNAISHRENSVKQRACKGNSALYPGPETELGRTQAFHAANRIGWRPRLTLCSPSRHGFGLPPSMA